MAQTQVSSPELKRQIFDAFELRITYDKQRRHISISATISDAVASVLQNANDLPEEVANVTQKDIAEAGFEPATFGLRGRTSRGSTRDKHRLRPLWRTVRRT